MILRILKGASIYTPVQKKIPIKSIIQKLQIIDFYSGNPGSGNQPYSIVGESWRHPICNFHDFEEAEGGKIGRWILPGWTWVFLARIQRTSLGGVGIAAWLDSALSAFSGALVGPSAFAPWWRWDGWVGDRYGYGYIMDIDET